MKKLLSIGYMVCLITHYSIANPDVTAPAKGKIYTVSVKNIGTVKMENVHPTVSVDNDPDGLVSIVDVTPTSAEIVEGATQDFKIKFDVGCPKSATVDKIINPKFKFSLSPAPNMPYYAPGLTPSVYSGSPGPTWDADFSLKVGPIFHVECTPPEQTIKDGESATHTIVITNTHPENDEEFNVSISGGGDGWFVSPGGFSNLKIGAGQSKNLFFTVSNNKATSDLNIVISVNEGSCNETKFPENLDNNENPGHIADHPDDNHSVANAQYPSKWLYDSKSPIGVLSSGFGEGINYLLGKFNVATTVVKTDLTILNEPGKSINDLKVLCIGSAGLNGLESSPTFRKKLADFVDQGGVLINLTTKNGYEFAALPGGEAAGYGWDEDQSCLGNAVSMTKYHQILSGQTTTNLDVNVDGYMTKWPLNATVLLQRNKNGMPALITYPYGKGTVISTTIFEDWAYGHYQSTQAGQYLIRDMVAWARMAKTLPEFSVGTDVSIPLGIINSSGMDAQRIAIAILDPNGKIVKSDTMPLALSADDTIVMDYSFGLAPNNPGIWSAQYTLLTDANSAIQDKSLGQMFVISNPAGVAKTQPITFDVNSDAENYANGSQGVFTITVWNHTVNDRRITAWWSFPHHYWTRAEAIYGSPGTCTPWHTSNLKETLEVPANGSKTITYSIPVYSDDRLWAQFADENDEVIGRATRGFYNYDPVCDIKVAMNKEEYKSGDFDSLNITIQNLQSNSFRGNVSVTVLDPDNAKVWENSYSIDLPFDIPIPHAIGFSLPEGSTTGAYTVKVEVTNNGNKSGSYTTFFILPDDFLAITPLFPGVLHEGDNAVSFGLENRSVIQLSSGTLEASLLDNAGSMVWSGSADFSLDGGLTSEVHLAIPIPSLQFGTYRLAYRARYNGHYSKEVREDVVSSCIISSIIDKPSYRIREPIVFDIGITNSGRFRYEAVICKVSLPGAGDQTSTVVSEPGQNLHQSLSINVPETMIAGTHAGAITLTLPSGSVISKAFSVIIPSSKIELSLDSVKFSAGDNVGIAVENTGGVDAAVKCSLFVNDSRKVIISQNQQSISLKADEKMRLGITIPANSVNGDYELTVRAFNQSVQDTAILSKVLSIDGLLTALNVSTDKQVYTGADAKNATADITVTQGKIENGKLNLMVSSASHASKTFKNGDWGILSKSVKAVAAGGSMISGSGYTIALKEDGTLEAWGKNDYGSCYTCNIPSGLSGVKTIAAGNNTAAAIKEDGNFVLWGSTGGLFPLPAGLTKVKAISFGLNHIIAIKEDGTVAAWGDNYNGQCNVPAGLSQVKAISTLFNHTIALKEDGTVVAWGCGNGYGECTIPPGLAGVKAVGAGMTFSVALKEDGGVVAWGDNRNGQCNVPVGLTGVKSISVGGWYVLALKENGSVIAWGDTASNSSGIVTNFSRLTNVKMIFAGPSHAIAIKEDGAVLGYGNNTNDQCNFPGSAKPMKAIGAGWNHTVALEIAGGIMAWGDDNSGQCDAPAGLTGVKSFSAGNKYNLALKEDGTIAAWGNNVYGQCNIPPGLSGVKAIAAGGAHSVALKEDGTIEAWGYNSSGQCEIPPGLSGVKAIAAGAGHTIVAKQDGSVVAWGNNTFYQSRVPTSLSGVVAVAAGSSHSVALKGDGTVVAWGQNNYGQCSIPTGLTGVIAITAAQNETVALKGDGNIVAFGQYRIPTGAPFTGVKSIAFGSHLVALKQDGSIVTAGNNSGGQCSIVFPWKVGSGERSLAMTYDAGIRTEWKTIFWNNTSLDTSIKMFTQTADSAAGLSTAPWTGVYQVSGSSITSPPGRWIGIKAVSAIDPVNTFPILDSVKINGFGLQQVWKDSQTVNITGAQSYAKSIGAATIPGKYLLEGTVTNGFGQLASYNNYPFYIAGTQLLLTFTTDKRTYKPGETLTVNGQIINNSLVGVTDLPCDFTLDGTSVYHGVYTLAVGETKPFTFTCTSPAQAFYLSGTVNGSDATDHFEVESPSLTAAIVAPSVVGRDPFDFVVNLTNSKKVGAVITMICDGETYPLTVPAGQTKSVHKQISITQTTTENVVVTGDVNIALQKLITYGEQVTVQVSPQPVYAEGIVTIPYSVRNSGQLDTKADISFTMGTHTIVKQVFVPVGGTISGELTFNQAAGNYSLGYSSFFGSGSASYKVAKQDKIAMQVQTKRYSVPKVLVLRDNGAESYYQTLCQNAGMEVTVSTSSFSSWDGTNPSLNGFNVVILPCAVNYNNAMPVAAQSALDSFVKNGGGLITTEWVTRGRSSGNFALMDSLLLFDPSQWSSASGPETYTKTGDHPIVAGLPASFASTFVHSGNAGGLKPGTSSILKGDVLPNVAAVKQYGKGRIVQFAIEGAALGTMCQTDTTIKKLMLNSLNWAGKSDEINLVRATITVSNEGYNGFDGQLSSQTDFFSKTEDMTLASGETKTINYDMDISSVEPGTYTFTSSALKAGNVLQQASQPFEIQGADIILTTTPTANNFAPGEIVTMTFGLKNNGMVEGNADIGLALNELADESRSSRVAPGVEKQESFIFQIPDDYPEGEYKAEFMLNDTVTEILFTVSGIKLAVAASFDKAIYQIGETATLNLDITSESGLTPSVYAKASSGGDEDREDFTLAPHQSIQLHVPVNENTLASVAYGIYNATGRALYLNTLYIRVVKGTITLYTDKSAYDAGESVTAYVATEETGELLINTSTGYTASLNIAGPTSFSFPLPDELASGTQSIRYQFNAETGVCNFDVVGYSLKVSDVTLNKQTYDPIDHLSAHLKVESNKVVSAIVKGWLRSPSGAYTDLFEVTRDLSAGETGINVSGPVNAAEPGTYKFVYGIYSSGTNLTLLTGSKSFDVRPAAIITVVPDKSAYNETDKANIAVGLYACGDYTGIVEILDGSDTVASKLVTFNGTLSEVLLVGPLAKGIHQLSARLRNDAGVTSEKGFEIAVVDMNIPLAPAGLALSRDGTIVVLAWNANVESDIGGYNVYRNSDKLNAVPFKSNLFRDAGLVAAVSYIYQVTAVDKTGNESAMSASVSVKIDNTAPVITMSPSANVVSTSPVTLTYSATDDIDPSPVIQAAYPSPTTFKRAGIYPISITATDAQGNRSSKAMTLTLNIPNAAPQLLPIADKNVNEGMALAFQLSATDPNGDGLLFYADGLPLGAHLDPATGMFFWTPGYNQSGEYTIVFTITDDGAPAKSASQTVKINVANVNQPPVIAVLRDTTINENDTLRLIIQALDSDSDPLVLLSENIPAGAQFDAATGSFLWVPDYNQAGSYPDIRFIIYDNGAPVLSDTASLLITVKNVNRAPILAAIGNMSVNEGELLAFSIAAGDSDGDKLNYSAGNLPGGATFDQNTRVFTWKPDYQQAGNYQNIVFTVTDDGEPRMSGQEQITISVGDVNLPPVLSAIGDKTVNEGDTLEFTISASDPDGNALVYSAGNLPTGATFDQLTKQFFWVPEFGRDGIYPDIFFTVTDDGQPAESDQEAISITVGHVNRPPVLAMIGSKSVIEGDSLKFTITATDPDNDDLVYSAGNLPDGAEFNSETQNFRWVPRYDQAGNYPDVLFTVTDVGQPQASDQEAITISVGEVNRPPVMAQIGDKQAGEGDTLKFSITAADPDGNQLSYSAGNLPAGAGFDPVTQTFEWIIPWGQTGAYPGVWFEVTDDGYPPESDRESITITVGKVNRAPVMGRIGDKTINECEYISFSVTATDPDGDIVILSATNLPTGASFDPATGAFSWTPASGQAGTYQGIVFTASDSHLSVSETISVTVNVNDGCSPLLDPAFDYAIIAGKDISWSGSGLINTDGKPIQADGRFATNGSHMFTADILSCVKITMSGSGTIHGNASAPSISKNGSGAITGTQTIGPVAPVAIPDMDLLPYHNWALSQSKVVNGDLNLNGSRDTIIPGGVLWVNGNVTISGSMSVTGCIVATGNVKISGSGDCKQKNDMPVIVSVNGSVTLSGSGKVTGLIYAKNGDIVKNGSGDLEGSMICKGTLTKTGGWSFLYHKYLPYPPGCAGK